MRYRLSPDFTRWKSWNWIDRGRGNAKKDYWATTNLKDKIIISVWWHEVCVGYVFQ